MKYVQFQNAVLPPNVILSIYFNAHKNCIEAVIGDNGGLITVPLAYVIDQDLIYKVLASCIDLWLKALKDLGFDPQVIKAE